MQFLRILIFSALTIFVNETFAQAKINAPLTDCLGNITNYSYTPPSGLTISSINWNFGDGFSSGATTPTHTYSNTGTYTILAQVTFTNSTNRTDSQKITIVNLPKPAFYFLKTSDTCFLSNHVCFKDTSSPAVPGQTITSRLMVWGDGSFSTKSNPVKGDSICHTYGASDRYTVKIELTDKFGCKNSVNAVINVVENIESKFIFVKDFTNCSTARVCLRNKSIGASISNSHYKWTIDNVVMDTGLYFNNDRCFTFTSTKNRKFSLIANANNNCIDTFSVTIPVVVDSLPTKIDLLDTVRCFGDYSQNTALIPNVARDDIRWYVDNGYYHLAKSNTFFFSTKFTPGTHTVKVEIIRGNCVHTITRNFQVLGPLAKMKTTESSQCFSDREVFFYENSLGINRDRCTFKWVIDDPYGDNCINYRAKDINKNTNCNESRDWYTRHKFTNAPGIMEVFVVVTDTVTGCFDTARTYINMKDCPPILTPDSFNVCQGEIFKDNILGPYPIKFSIDSGKVWRMFPSVVDKPLKGKYDVGFVFKTELFEWVETIGDDSIKIHKDTIEYYDTIFRKQFVWIHTPRTDSITQTTYGNCSPFRTTIKFSDGFFKKGEKLLIVWGDSGNIDIEFPADTQLDSVTHIYNMSGFSRSILVEMTNVPGCIIRKRLDLQKGIAMSYNTPKFINCIYDSVCFYPGVYSFKENRFWSDNTPNNFVKWDFPDGGGINTKFKPCVKFNKGGLLPFKLITSDSFGCKDTLVDSVFVQDLKAGYKSTAKIVYCSELKQFFDSSSHYKNPKYRQFLPVTYIDSIKKYMWQFGNGTFSSLQKNPLQTLNTSLDKIPAAHAIESVSGCVDTVRFEIEVIGPKPYFLIKDTIGCNSLNAQFVNLSKNCKQYIWQFGDSANTTLQKFDKQDVNFNYTKPGRYYISLVGIDTVFNPFTNTFQYCYNTFPDKLFQKDTQRTVLVLPLLTTGILSKDTICLGEEIEFTSKSDTSYAFDFWTFDDSTGIDTLIAPSSVKHTFSKFGTYDVKVLPAYTDSLYNICRDSATKKVVVTGVDADFDIDPSSNPPLFIFKNKTNPISASYDWNFGQLGSQNSTEQDPSYNYGNDTGTYLVCLISSVPYGCRDTVCKNVLSDYISDFKIYNVFTPGLIDNKNDQFDIQIEGESTYELMIYNRWGVLVYESHEDSDNSENKNWNGKVNNIGPECPSGTYYYIFKYSLKSEKDKSNIVQGTITLIR